MIKISRKLKKQLIKDASDIETVFKLSAISARVVELDFFNESSVSYYIELAIGIKIDSVLNLKNEISSSLNLNPNLISIKPIYEKGLIEISVPKSSYLEHSRLRTRS